jgi:hypothetical protein
MAYKVELSSDDIAYIKAAVLCTVRLSQESMSVQKAVDITNAAATAIQRLNESRLDTTHVMFINTCIQKTRDLLLKDVILPRAECDAARRQGESIQNKLAGVGVDRWGSDATTN